MRTSTTKYTTKAGLLAIAVVLAAALVLAGCKPEAESSVGKANVTVGRTETQLEKDIKALAEKGPGTYTVTAPDTLTNKDLYIGSLQDALESLPEDVKVRLDLSNATGLTSIKEYTFSGCDNLESVKLHKGVTSIEQGAFSGCDDLKSVEGIEGVTSIGESAFSSCERLESITIPETVTSIGKSAFSNCKSLESITIPEKVTTLHSNVFYGCTNLTEVRLPNTMNSIEGQAFYGCTKLTTISTYGEETTPGGTGIGANAFWTPSLSNFALPKSIKELSGGLFSSNNNIQEVTLQEGLQAIESVAFSNCEKLETITIPTSVTSIGRYAFSKTGNLKSVTFADSSSTWTVTGDSETQTGITVENPDTNATNLKQRYHSYDWTKTGK